jgi:hypothetical protein
MDEHGCHAMPSIPRNDLPFDALAFVRRAEDLLRFAERSPFSSVFASQTTEASETTERSEDSEGSESSENSEDTESKEGDTDNTETSETTEGSEGSENSENSEDSETTENSEDTEDDESPVISSVTAPLGQPLDGLTDLGKFDFRKLAELVDAFKSSRVRR